MAQRSEIMVQRSIYQIAVVTLLAALMWMGVGVYQASLRATEVTVDKDLLSPVNPTIDLGIVTGLGNRSDIMEEEIIIDEGNGDELVD